jgi:ABC-type transport system involved in multi-copper enzyme maturation permease subunit
MMPRYPIWLVARQEFRVRLRTGYWRWLLVVWVIVLGAFTALLHAALAATSIRDGRGVPVFGLLMFFVLALILVISPALTAQSVNGDRERGTLATLQVTGLRPVHIALGKLVAGWGVGLVALALTVPFVAWAFVDGGITGVRVAALYGVVALLIGVVCAVSQALSALLARSITSALLSYVVVFALTVGTLIGFALMEPIVSEQRVEHTPAGDLLSFQDRTDRIWWLLAPNPFVVLADSAPQLPPTITQAGDRIDVNDNDPLSGLGREVRNLRKPPDVRGTVQGEASRAYPVWPYGLGFDLLLGTAAVAVTIRRLRTPYRRVPRGVRVA